MYLVLKFVSCFYRVREHQTLIGQLKIIISYLEVNSQVEVPDKKKKSQVEVLILSRSLKLEVLIVYLPNKYFDLN